MPRLHRSRVNRQPLPAHPPTKALVLHNTGEVFTDYDSYYDRSVLANSNAWACQYCGKNLLSFEEAEECEECVRKDLLSFPSALVRGLLVIAKLTGRGNTHNVADDLFNFAKDRFFIGEAVEVVMSSIRYRAVVRKVVYRPWLSVSMLQVQEEAQYRGRKSHRVNLPSPDDFYYTVRVASADYPDPVTMTYTQLQRRRGMMRKETVKAMVDYCMYVRKGLVLALKPAVEAKVGLVGVTFDHVFAGPLPSFSQTPLPRRTTASRRSSAGASGRRGPRLPDDCEELDEETQIKIYLVQRVKKIARTLRPYPLKPEDVFVQLPPTLSKKSVTMAEKKKAGGTAAGQSVKRQRKQKLEARPVDSDGETAGKSEDAVDQLCRERQERQEMLANKIEAKQKEKEERNALKMQLKQQIEEEKKKIKEQRRIEREQLREEKKKQIEIAKEQNRKYEDTEIKTSASLPETVCIKTRLGHTGFGMAVTVLEMIAAYSKELDMEEEVPAVANITYEMLESSLFDSSPEGMFSDLVIFLLNSVFRLQEEEEQEYGDTPEVAPNVASQHDGSGDGETCAAVVDESQQQVDLVRNLTLDRFTVSEILRLHIMSSREKIPQAAARHMYQQRGAYTLLDNPTFDFHVRETHIMDMLLLGNIFDLSPVEKLKVLQVLFEQIMTFASIRNHIEDTLEWLHEQKKNLRLHILAEKQRLKEVEQSRIQQKKEKKNLLRPELAMMTGEETAQDIDSNQCNEKENELKRQYEEKLVDLRRAVWKVQALVSLQPIGTDRAYRRYWIFNCIPGVYVEEFELNPGVCPEFSSETTDNSFNGSSDKENDHPENATDSPTISDTHSENVENLSEEQTRRKCTSSIDCPVHGKIPDEPKWSYVASLQDFDVLVESLNIKGVRESRLKEALTNHRGEICDTIIKTPKEILQNHVDVVGTGADCGKLLVKGAVANDSAEEHLELVFRRELIDLENKVVAGNLGQMADVDRSAWRDAVCDGSYIRPSDLDDATISDMSDGTPQAVVDLRCALYEIARSVDKKYLKPPLGKGPERKQRKGTRPSAVTNGTDETSVPVEVDKGKWPVWVETLKVARSLPQLFLHLSILDRSIQWSMSLLNKRCRVCRSKGDDSKMLLCDGCEKGTHIYCLKPALKSVPQGEWFCIDCTKKARKKKLSAHREAATNDVDDSDTDTVTKFSTAGSPGSVSDQEDVSVGATDTNSKKGKPKREVLGGDVGTGKRKRKCPLSEAEWEVGTGALSNSIKAENISVGQAKGNKKRKSGLDAKESHNSHAKRSSLKHSHAHHHEATNGVLHESAVQNGLDEAAGRRGATSSRRLVFEEARECEHLVRELRQHEDAWPFLRPVSRAVAPDYYDVVKRPIDLGTIGHKLKTASYSDVTEFHADMDLLFQNCELYNVPTADVYQCGVRLCKYYQANWKELGLPQLAMANTLVVENKTQPGKRGSRKLM